jgi:hypothetical protein
MGGRGVEQQVEHDDKRGLPMPEAAGRRCRDGVAGEPRPRPVTRTTDPVVGHVEPNGVPGGPVGHDAVEPPAREAVAVGAEPHGRGAEPETAVAPRGGDGQCRPVGWLSQVERSVLHGELDLIAARRHADERSAVQRPLASTR